MSKERDIDVASSKHTGAPHSHGEAWLDHLEAPSDAFSLITCWPTPTTCRLPGHRLGASARAEKNRHRVAFPVAGQGILPGAQNGPEVDPAYWHD